jgi:hypothetical protein
MLPSRLMQAAVQNAIGASPPKRGHGGRRMFVSGSAIHIGQSGSPSHFGIRGNASAEAEFAPVPERMRT